MIELFYRLFSIIWREEIVPPQWREGLVVDLLRKVIRKTPRVTGV